MKRLSRRDVLIAGAGAIATGPIAFRALARDVEGHGLSAFGDLAYPADFKHLKYVNPTAPKGGTFSQLAGTGTNTFNSFNGFVLKGDPALDMALTFASLMARAEDEPDAVYGLAAEKVAVSADRRNFRFTLRPDIKFHDGTPITAADVAYLADDHEGKGPSLSSANMLREIGRRRRDRRSHRGAALFREASRATRRCLPRPCRSSPRRTTRTATSTRPRSTLRSAPAPTRSASSSRAASSSSSASRIGGARTCRSPAACTTSMSSATSITATATPRSKASAARATRSARSSPRGSGRRATTSRRSRTAASSARPFPTSGPPARKAG